MMTIKAHFVAAIAAISILLAGLFGIDSVQRFWNEPDTFMKVHVFVPDYKQGEDPTVRFTREIFREMRGIWTVEVRNLESPGATCNPGSGAAIYSPKEHRVLPLLLSEYLGAKCLLMPGQYIMATRWDLTDDLGQSAVVLDITEPFTVLPN